MYMGTGVGGDPLQTILTVAVDTKDVKVVMVG